MPAESVPDILKQISDGDHSGYDRLIPLIVDELRSLAENRLRKERVDHTLQPTALVNEAYLRLADLHSMTWRDHAHFLAAASGVMHRILVESARAKKAEKRGRGWERVTLGAAEADGDTDQEVDIEALHHALEKLAELDARQAKIVECRFFGAMTHAQISEVLGMSVRTVEADWSMARTWLRRELSKDDA